MGEFGDEGPPECGSWSPAALDELDKALALRREAFRHMRRLAEKQEDRWLIVASEAVLLTELLVRLDKPAETELVAKRLVSELAQLGHEWAEPVYAQALRMQAQMLGVEAMP